MSLVGPGIEAAYPQLGPGIDAALRLTSAPLPISRTGYNEIDVIDPKTKNIKLNGALHYKLNKEQKPLLPDIVAQAIQFIQEIIDMHLRI